MISSASGISIVVGGSEIRGWTEYTITSSLLDAVAQFSMVMPFDRLAWDLMRKERRCSVRIDGVTVLTGLLDERDTTEDDDVIQVSGRNLIGRLVQESAPSIEWQGLTLTQLIERLAAPWFTRVILSNAKNRRVLLGKGHKAAVGAEPVRVDPRPGGLLAEPGATRWAIIEQLLKQVGMIAWSSGDGTTLIVGRPNYDQEPQWRLFRPAPASKRTAEATVLGMGVKVSTADRYSRVIVTGSSRGTATNYGPAVASRYGVALDSSGEAGVGGDFLEPKTLVQQMTVKSIAEAKELAAREMARRQAHAVVVAATASDHGQRIAGARARTTFTVDTMASVEHESTGTKGAFMVTSCTYTSNRRDGERTKLELLRKGAELTP